MPKAATSRSLTFKLGLMDYKARMYDPFTGRFIQPDTLVPEPGSSQGYNRYTYTNNNPINFADPSGHRPLDEIDFDEWVASRHELYLPPDIDSGEDTPILTASDFDNTYTATTHCKPSQNQIDYDVESYGDSGNPVLDQRAGASPVFSGNRADLISLILTIAMYVDQNTAIREGLLQNQDPIMMTFVFTNSFTEAGISAENLQSISIRNNSSDQIMAGNLSIWKYTEGDLNSENRLVLQLPKLEPNQTITYNFIPSAFTRIYSFQSMTIQASTITNIYFCQTSQLINP